jgi:ABC-2 type transport system ATP-binding protein
VAVRGIDLQVEQGEIFALLGPNGAGKTTTLEILEGFRGRSSGDVSVLGVDPEHGGRAWRDRIGVVLQESLPEAELTVRECLALYAGYYTAPRGIDETLAEVGLMELADRRCEQLSGGQVRRLDVALALIGNPELVFLDEPTTGFDPGARRAMWDLVEELSHSGVTIVLTTHYMDEAERLADRIAVMAQGKIVALDTPKSLGSTEDASAEISFTLPLDVTVSELPIALGTPVATSDGKVRVVTDDSVSTVFSLTRWALVQRHKLLDLEIRRSSLEDIYLELTSGAEQRP